MRLLHTSDWHLGKVLKGIDRTPEIVQAMKDLLEIVKKERVDLVAISGDLFDRRQPSVEAEAHAVEFFLRLRELGVPALVIAGNHDPKERLEALSPLFAEVGVTVRGKPLFQEEGGVVEVKGLRAALLPFVSERILVKHVLAGEEERYRTYAEAMRRILDNLQSPLMLGHFALEKARPGGGEFIFHISGTYVVPRAVLPLSARYLALGHIHRQQQVSEAPVAWYSGSLIQLDFGEGEDADRGALLVELPPSGPPKVHPIRERWGKPLRTVKLSVDEVEGRIDELRGFPGYLKLVVEGDFSSATKERWFKALPNLLEVETRRVGAPLRPLTRKEVKTWEEAYREYLEGRGNKKIGLTRLMEAFKKLQEEVEREALGVEA